MRRSLIEPGVTEDWQHVSQLHNSHAGLSGTYNSWITLSNVMTANSREAMAVAEMSVRAMMRKREDVFSTADTESAGNGKANFCVAMAWRVQVAVDLMGDLRGARCGEGRL